MTSKRDVQLVRLACRWRWLTAEQGEECLALERKLAGKHRIEEIIRRKGFLSDEALADLTAAAEQVGARRRPLFGRAAEAPEPAPRRVVPPRSEQTVVRAFDFLPATPASPAPSTRPSRRPRPSGLPRDARRAPPAAAKTSAGPPAAPTRVEAPPAERAPPGGGALGSAVPALAEDDAAAADARIAEPAHPSRVGPPPSPPEVTRFEPLPWFARDEDAPFDEPELPDAARSAPIPREQTRFEPGFPASLDEPELPPASARGGGSLDVVAARSETTSGAAPAAPPGPPDAQDRTVVAELPAELLARLRGPDLGRRPERAPSAAELEPPTGELEVPPLAEPTPDVPVMVPSESMEVSRSTAAEAPRPRERSWITEDRRAHPSDADAVPTYDGATPLAATPDLEPAPPRDPSEAPLARLPEPALPALPVAGVDPLAGGALDEAPLDGDPSTMSLLEEEGLAEALLGPFGPYELTRIIARGRQSVVYLGKDVETGAQVAVKVLARDPSDNQAFISERGGVLIAAAAIRSPYVARVLDVGRVDTRHYVTLEHVEGWSLADKLAFEAPPSPARAFAWAGQVATGLAAAWAAGVAHGDVGPDRVLIDPVSRARLGGFGFAPLEPDPDDPDAPPEGPSGTAAADAYGLGRVLWAALTGGREDAALPESLPPSARALVHALLDPDPAARPADFAGLAAQLSEYATDLERAPAAPEPDRRPPLRGVLLRAAGATAGLLALTVLAFLGLSLSGLEPALTSQVVLHSALAGAVGLAVATVLLGTLDLIRRGELPLPLSTQWLVQVAEGAGVFGALAVVVQLVLGPPAAMNLVLAVLGAGLAFSAVLGVGLRRAVANARADRGVGRMLAVLSDPWLQRWRTWHGPALTTLTFLAVARFALLAYFAAS